MAIPKIVGAQRDFSAGELDESIKRADDNQIMRTGARQMLNWRVLNSKAAQNRPGRDALFVEKGRVDEVLVAPGTTFFLAFGLGYLKIYNVGGGSVFSTTTRADNVTPINWVPDQVVWVPVLVGINFSVYIFYSDSNTTNNVPQILTWVSGNTWTFSTFAPSITGSAQKRTAFTRLSPIGVTMQPSATTGNITVTFSQEAGPILASGMVGAYFLYCGKELQLTAVSGAYTGSATVIEPLPPSQNVSFSSSSGKFAIGDEVIGSVTGATGIVTNCATQQTIIWNFSAWTGNLPLVGDVLTGASSGATGTVIAPIFTSATQFSVIVSLNTATLFTSSENVTDSPGGGSGINNGVGSGALIVQLLPDANGNIAQFSTSDVMVGPNGSGTITSTSLGSPQAVATWDDELMNGYRGYPTSGFFDQSRLGMCNFPALAYAILWSAISLPNDSYIQATSADNAILEFAPALAQVLYVVPGMESSEFVFCTTAIYYIPISPTSPLEPGSVTFQTLATFGIQPNIQPRASEQSIVFVKAGGAEIGAVQALGAYYRPFIVDSLSELHSHLFTASNAVAIAIPNASNQFEERYLYILLANGTLVTGKYTMRQGMIEPGQDGKPKVGWLPWSGSGTTTWVSALGSDVLFVTSYAPNNVTAVSIVEKLDNSQYLDGAFLVNNPPGALIPGGGKGPCYIFPGPNSTVFLFDLGLRYLGSYAVDANGWIIPQYQQGENLLSTQLVCGQTWEAVLEPFTPIAGPGNDVGQRMKKRRAARMIAYVSNSTGFLLARLFSGPITPTSPALGSVVNERRIPAYNLGDNPAAAAPLREAAYQWRPLGRAYDPRYAVIKDIPGPLTLHEIGFEASV